MKIRELKKKLNHETEQIVPDVLHKVKKVPINGMLNAETPTQIFRRKLLVLLIVPMLIAFISLIVVVTAFAVRQKPASDAKPNNYIKSFTCLETSNKT